MIRCFINRRKLSASVDADHELDPGLHRHVESCKPCQQFYEQELSLARALARSATKERVAPSPFLQARIMTAVDRGGAAAHSWPWVTRLAWTAGLATACVALFFVVHGPFTPHPVAARPDLRGALKELTTLEKRMPDQRKLEQWSGTVDQPLDKEMRSLLHDARNVAQTLVVNFLPQDMARSAIGESGAEQ
jgi:hypothetical protein